MKLMLASFESIGILFIMGAFGWWLHGRKFFSAGIMNALTVLSLEVALPCMVFTSILTHFTPSENTGWWRLPLWWMAFTAVAGGLTVVCGWLVSGEFRREFRYTLFYQNAVFIPLAVLTELFGGSSYHVVQLFLLTLFFSAFFFNTTPLFLRSSRMPTGWRRFVHPVLIITLVAMGIRLTDVQHWIPVYVTTSLRQVGDMSIPLLMMMMGGKMRDDYQKGGAVYLREIVLFVATKNFLFPAVVLGLLVLVRPSPAVALLLLLQAAVPPVVTAPIMVEREGGNGRISSQMMMSSFAVSLVSIPLAIWVYSRLFPL